MEPGYLVLVVGPSGAGKDSILVRARASLVHDKNFLFPIRIVTRESDSTEQTQLVSRTDFERLEAMQGLALSWRAHGLAYGLPVSIDAEIEAGRIVIANVSRAIVAAGRERYGNCSVVLVTADAETRARRLAQRGRESDEQRSARFRREASLSADIGPNLTIANEGTLDQAVNQLLSHLTGLAAERHRRIGVPVWLLSLGRTDREFVTPLYI